MAWILGLVLKKKNNSTRRTALILQGFSFAAFAWILTVSVGYLIAPNFYDHGELNIGSIAAHWLNGFPIYTTMDAAERYSVLYGPSSYLNIAVFQALGLGTLFATKLPGFIALLITLTCSYLLVKQLNFQRAHFIILLGALVACLLGFDNMSYWDRPDSFLTSYALISLLLIIKLPAHQKSIFYVVTGILIGLAINFKAHGFIYFLPFLFLLIEERPDLWSPLLFLVSVVLVGITTVAPFLIHNISLTNYMIWLRMATHHGWSWDLFADDFTYIFPFVVTLYFCGFQKKYLKTFLSLLVSLFLIAIIGAKPGAGTHHYLPLLPVTIYLGAMGYSQLNEEQKKKTSLIIAAFLIALFYDAFSSQRALGRFIATIPMQMKEITELKELSHKYSGPVEMGYGDGDHYRLSFYKPYLVARGGSLLVEDGAFMDMKVSGHDFPKASFDKLKSCDIPHIFIPTPGAPWSIPNFYGGQLFSQTWIDTFNGSYKLVEMGRYFSVYECVKK